MKKISFIKSIVLWCKLMVIAGAGLQIFFVVHIALMRFVDPPSTAFERSQIWQIVRTEGALPWRQEWTDAGQISINLKRAVMASEDSAFVQHNGIWWDSIEKAWGRNAKAKAKLAQRIEKSGPQTAAPSLKIIGGSTITQQLAKNLLLSGERTLFRKGQELILTMALEACLSKQRILEIYLNHVEWGAGVFGAEAAAHHYFKKSAAELTPWEAARLSVMLPRPRFFEKRPQSPYLSDRAQTIVNRMNNVTVP